MAHDHVAIHLLAGGIGGTTGAVLTCPLEVVKTRLQSSVASFGTPVINVQPQTLTYVPGVNFSTCTSTGTTTSCSVANTCNTKPAVTRTTAGLFHCLSHIVRTEGTKGLFKGLGPNLVGVAPSRAIYFHTYATSKKYLNNMMTPDTPMVHICSAACAGFSASTATNPIWYIKTRLQLDQKRKGNLTVMRCIQETWKDTGIRGFYKGITASYYGIGETVIHFVLYEAIKARLRELKGVAINNEQKTVIDFVEFMGAGACSKTIATCIAYPHEVARTRLREKGVKYTGFWQTLGVVWREEGYRGLYRGLVTQLVRQIPNTAIMMATYEAVVYLCISRG